jgi:hypothetical protein
MGDVRQAGRVTTLVAGTSAATITTANPADKTATTIIGVGRVGSAGDDQLFDARRVRPRVDVEGATEIVEVHDLLDDPRDEVVVQTHDSTGVHADTPIGGLAGNANVEFVERRRQATNDAVAALGRNRGTRL